MRGVRKNKWVIVYDYTNVFGDRSVGRIPFATKDTAAETFENMQTVLQKQKNEGYLTEFVISLTK